MKTNQASTLSTAVIAFATVLGLMIGFYYNLKSSQTKILYIWILELLLLALIILLTKRVDEGIENGY